MADMTTAQAISHKAATDGHRKAYKAAKAIAKRHDRDPDDDYETFVHFDGTKSLFFTADGKIICCNRA